jgi:hypothetical protein
LSKPAATAQRRKQGANQELAMRNRLVLLVTLGLLATPAFAGGMGDPSTVLKEKNAICEAQKRGEGPRYPNMCLPEYPPDGPPGSARGAYR